MMKIKTETIGDQRIEIEVSEDGMFSAEFDDRQFEANTLDGLQQALIRAVKRARDQRAVPVTVLGLVKSEASARYETDPFEAGDGLVHATLRGRHDREHAWLLTAEDGTKFKLREYSRSWVMCRRLSADAIADYLRFTKTLAMARKTLEAFENEHGEDPKDLLAGSGEADHEG